MSETTEPAAPRQQALLREAVTDLLAARFSAVFVAGLLALAMLAACVGAAVGANAGTGVDVVLLFTATTMALVGVVCGVFTLLSLKTLRRDALQDIALSRPRPPRLPRTAVVATAVLMAGMAAAAVIVVFLWPQSVPLAVGLAVACLLAGLIGWAGEASLRLARSTLAQSEVTDPAVTAWFAEANPVWLHDALTREPGARRPRSR